MISDPNSPKPLSHDRSRLRVIASPASSIAGFTGAFIFLLPFAKVDQLLDVRPKHLILRVFEVPEIILLHCEDENEQRPNSHKQTGDNRDPCQFHRCAKRGSIAETPLLLYLSGHSGNPDWFLVQAIAHALSSSCEIRHGSAA